MTAASERQGWEQYAPYRTTKQPQTVQFQDRTQFVQVRRSRKGTCLNIPAQFYTETRKKQAYIGNFPIIQSGGCGDVDYVATRHNLRKGFPKKKQTCCNMKNTLKNCPSVTINIMTNPGFQNKRRFSHSTISINPSNTTEEPWVQQKIVIPQGLRCCEDRNLCEHKQSTEQKVINLETSKRKINNEEAYVYVTCPPTISPLKTCWNFLNCKKKKRKGEVYMPSVMEKTDLKDCLVCPKHSSTDIKEPHLLSEREINRTYYKSRLSTISESVMSISEYSSEEFMTQAERERKDREKRLREYLKKTYSGTGKKLETSSSLQSLVVNQQGQIYRWVCKPAEEKNKIHFGNFGTKKYICYKEALD